MVTGILEIIENAELRTFLQKGLNYRDQAPPNKRKAYQVKNELKRLQEKYVFVPTDKAKNNVSLVCKKFYDQLLHDEISSDTYQLSTESEADIINRHSDFLKEHGIKLKSENEKLPIIYTVQLKLEMHKDAMKFRFITAGSNSSLKQISVLVGYCLQKCLKVAKNHFDYINRFYPRNDFYVIDSNKDP